MTQAKLIELGMEEGKLSFRPKIYRSIERAYSDFSQIGNFSNETFPVFYLL